MRGKGFINIERACVNKGITLYAHNTLIPIALGKCIAHDITRIIIDRYKALATLFETPSSTTFQRCFRALLGGFIVYIRPHNCGSYSLY